MIIYTNKCMACFNRKRVREIKSFCVSNGLKLEERRTTYNKAWQDEAQKYDMPFPFIVNGDKAVGLYGDLKEVL